MKIALQNDIKVMTVAYPRKLKNAISAREIIKKQKITASTFAKTTNPEILKGDRTS